MDTARYLPPHKISLEGKHEAIHLGFDSVWWIFVKAKDYFSAYEKKRQAKLTSMEQTCLFKASKSSKDLLI